MVSSSNTKGLMQSHTDESDIYFTEEISQEEEISPGYARVTEILSPWVDFSKIDPQVLQNAADRGTRVHLHCENYANLLGLHACHMFDLTTVDDQCLPYVQSYIGWFDENVDAVYECEKRVYCDQQMFCGKPDQIVHLKGDPEDCLTLIDIKTPASKQKSWNLQTAAYMYLINFYTDISVSKRGTLMLKKSGKVGVFSEHTDSDMIFGDIDLFISACKLHHYFNTNKRKL